MKYVRLCCFTVVVVLLVVSCSSDKAPSNPYDGVAPVRVPTNKLNTEDLRNYTLAYCLRPVGPDSAEEDQTVIVVSRGDGSHSIAITSPRPPRFSLINLGCFGTESFLLRGVHPVAWRPGYNQLTMAMGPADLPNSFYFVDISEEVEAHLPGKVVDRISDNLYGPYYELTWSPNGEWLAIRAMDGNTPSLDDVWLYSPETGQITRVTDLSKSHDPINRIAWASNGLSLAMSYSQRLAGIGISRLDELSYVSVSNENQPLLRNWPQDWFDPTFLLQAQLDGSSRPVWINQDQHVVFTAPSIDGRVTLFVVRADGTDLQELLPGLPGLVNRPTLAPDRRRLAFVRFPGWADRPDRAEIAVADLETKNIVSLVVLPAPANGDMLYISGLDWTPDGKYLAFSSNHAGSSDVYVISADGGAWSNLTEKIDGDAVNPIWRP